MPACDFQIRRIQIDVEGDQKFSRANHASAGRGMKRGFAKIRQAFGIVTHLFAQVFEEAAADVS